MFQRKLSRRRLPLTCVYFVSHASAQALRPITFTQRFRTTRRLILVISNRTRAARSFDFENHAYDLSPNCTPLSAITIINETLNNFKCTLQIRATSSEELGKLKKKEIIYYESHLVSHRKTPAVSGICLVCHLERNIYYIK